MIERGQVQSVSMRAGALHAGDSSPVKGGKLAAVTAMAARGVALAALAACLASCSLVSLKSPEKPLPTRDFNARLLTHDFATRFNTAVEQTADDMAAGTEDPGIRLNTLRWKIGAEGASTRAASQILPMVGFLDMWGLTIQMREFLADGAGRSLFGAEQPRAVTLAAQLEREADDLARGLMEPTEYVSEKQFVDGYATANPIANLSFARASILDLWAHDRGTKTRLVDSLGTLPEALGQTSDMLRLYGNNFTSQALWRAQLAAQESGISGQNVNAMIKHVDERLARLSALAESTPQLVNGVVRDVSKRADASWVEMMGTIRAERMALSTSVSAERQAAVEAVDKERAAVAADATRLANQIISNAGEEARRLVREALMLIIGLAVVVLGLPFVAGYYVGRAQRRP
jgi:hypothetical protein